MVFGPPGFRVCKKEKKTRHAQVAQATSKKISGIEGLSPAKDFIDGIPQNH